MLTLKLLSPCFQAIVNVENWEQNRREPEGAARLLLSIIDVDPAAVRRV